jgi:hypothetical protein
MLKSGSRDMALRAGADWPIPAVIYEQIATPR